jgi:hypothetical protein
MDKVPLSEAARQVGVHPNTIRNWRKAGKLKSAEKIAENGTEVWIVEPSEVSKVAAQARPGVIGNINYPVAAPGINEGSTENPAELFELIREGIVRPLTELVERQSDQIKEMAEELGTLKERVRQLEAKHAETPPARPKQTPEPSPVLNRETLQPEPPKKRRWWQF